MLKFSAESEQLSPLGLKGLTAPSAKQERSVGNIEIYRDQPANEYG